MTQPSHNRGILRRHRRIHEDGGKRELGEPAKKDSTRTRREEGRFLTALEHWSSDVSEVEEIEINSYARDSRPYSTSSYTVHVNLNTWLNSKGDIIT
jgi:hypothetical protein